MSTMILDKDWSRVRVFLRAVASDMHRQTKAERDAWKAAFQQPVINGLLDASEDAEATQLLIQQIQDLYP